MLELNRLLGQSSLGTDGARLLRERGERRTSSEPVSGLPARLPAELAGRFSLARELPAGGEADLLVVRDAAGAEFVLKLYRAGIVPSPEAWTALRAIESPYVARLVDWGDAGGRAFEVMEYVGTETLSDVVRDRSNADLGPSAIAEVVRQVAAGLDALHKARVIHRDLKPANILLRSRSPLRLALADFGLSRYLENATAFSAAGHTLAYTAPETFAGHVSPARDWWSLGMIVRELATGEPPFDGLSTEVVLLSLAARPIDCLQVADPRLRLLCRGLLVRDPAARWSAAEVTRWLAGESPEVDESGAAAQARQRGASRRISGEQCPFRGLAPYEEYDASVFCGRDQLTAELLAAVSSRLDQGGIVFVTGPSGVGKSSLLRAGLLPGIADGRLGPGSPGWPRVLMTPGRAPLDELAVRLASLCMAPVGQLRELLDDGPGETLRLLRQAILVRAAAQRESQSPVGQTRLILVIDQFEEIFTLAGKSEREQFIKILEGLAAPPAGPGGPAAMVILGLRADFYSECIAYEPLARALRSATFLVAPMTRSDIRTAITQPAALAGLALGEGLVDAVMADLGSAGPLGEPGAGMLPLLSQAMLATWQHRTGSTLTVSAYQAGGGVRDSISRSAESAYRSLTPGEQRAARRLLGRLVTVVTDGRMTRRVLDRAELASATADNDTSAALAALARARLIVLQRDNAEIAHESLLDAWPRLQEWLTADAARIQVLGQIAQSSKTWAESGRDPAYLYRSTPLALALDILDDKHDLTDTTREFLAASRRLQQRVARWRRGAVAVLIALILCSASAAGIAVHQAVTARAQRAIAMSDQVAFESQTVSDPATSALLAAAAWHIAPTSQARNALITAFIRGSVRTLSHSGPVSSLLFSPDGRILATVGRDGAVVLWNAATGRPADIGLRVGSATDQMAFSPDGRLLAAAGQDGTVRLWDVATGQPTGAGLMAGTGTDRVAFSPRGNILATGGRGGPVRLWDVATGRVRATLPGSAGATALAFSPDGQVLAANDATGVGLWHVPTGRPAAVITAGAARPLTALAFSPDGKFLVAGGGNVAVVWQLNTSTSMTSSWTGVIQAGSGRTQMAFSPDGKMLETASTDGTVRLWDPVTLQQLGMPVTADGISEAAFSPDGRTLATASAGVAPEVQLWSLPATTSPAPLVKAICAEAGHGLTPAQWRHRVAGAPYQRPCPP